MAWAVYKPAFHRAVKTFTPNLTWVCLVIPLQYASALLEVVQRWSRDCTGILIHSNAINPKLSNAKHTQAFHTLTHTSLILFIFIELQSNKNSAPYTKSQSLDKQRSGQPTGFQLAIWTRGMKPKVQTYKLTYKLKVQTRTHSLTTGLRTHKSVVTHNIPFSFS